MCPTEPDSDLSLPAEAPKSFSWEEVRRHRYASDCWVVCEEKVYDITEFVPKHPGGPRLWTFGGGDVTIFFSAMHPPRVTVASHLEKYYIGQVAREDSKGKLVLSEQYHDLRAFVWDRLSKHFGIERGFASVFRSPLTWTLWYPFVALMYYAGLVAMLYLPQDVLPLWGRSLLAVYVGIVAAHVSFVVHDATHARMRYDGLFWSLVLGDLSGFWTHAFTHEHHEHHRTLGDDECDDPDIFDNMPFLRHRDVEPRRPWHRCQHLYFPIGWMTCLLKSAVMDLWRLIQAWGVYNSKRDILGVFVAKAAMGALVAGSIIAGPFQGSEAWQLIVVLVVLFATAGCVIGMVVGIVHIAAFSESHRQHVKPAEHGHGRGKLQAAEVDQHGGMDASVSRDVEAAPIAAARDDFMQCAIRGSVSIVPGKVLNFFTLGLAFHVEHHLFPSVPWWLLPQVNALVTEYCTEHGIKCNNQLSWRAGYALYIEALRDLGSPDVIPVPKSPATESEPVEVVLGRATV